MAIFGLFLLGMLLFVLCKEKIDVSQLGFVDEVQGMIIKPFYDEKDDVYYLFLPAYAGLNKITITKPDDVSVDFATSERDYGSDFSELPLDEPISLTIAANHRIKKFNVRIMQGKNLKTLFIETGDGAMEKVNLNKGDKAPASVVVVNSDGSVGFSGLGSITGRGNSTWSAAKKPYNLKFSQPVNLMGGERKSFQNWCLLANYLDDSQIRNDLCYYIADKVGVKYTSNIDFVSLYINGEYYGLYNLATKQNYLTDAEDILAVFELNDFTNNARLYDDKSDHDFYFRTRYGETGNIKKAINAFENVLYSDNVTYSQLENYADLHSIARKYFVDAVCALNDVGHSQYYMLDKDSAIFAICAWDYDTSWGNTWIPFSFSFNAITSGHPWYNALFKFKEFRQELLTLWEQHSDSLNLATDEHAKSVMDSIRNDWVMNNARWRNYPEYNPKAKFRFSGYDRNSLEDQAELIQDLYQKRMSFLRDYWSSPERFYEITFVNPASTPGNNVERVMYCHINDSLTSDMLPNDMYYDSEGNDITWYSDEGISIDSVGIVTHDMSFSEKILSQNHGMKDKMHKYLLLICVLPFFLCLIGLLVFKTVILPIRESRK